MSEIEIKKRTIILELHGLCAHCSTGSKRQHRCPAQEISARVQALRGVPLVVNSQFKGMLWA